MRNQIHITIQGNDYTAESLYADIEAAKKKGLSNKYAFTPETVEALLDYIIESTVTIQEQRQSITYYFNELVKSVAKKGKVRDEF